MIRAIHHVQITVPPQQTQRARQFYCEVLGLREIERPAGMRPGGFWVAVGEGSLHVSVEEFSWRGDTRAHVAYETDDLAGVRSRLIAAGLKIEDDPVAIPGHVRLQTRDPFGNHVEFIQRLSRSADTTAEGRR